jgi:BirA family transcriptional regulator, biotin operon repressor / biotin---[acetyl-CoA-carboxylase] ligase
MSETSLERALSVAGIPEHHYFASIGSTNDEALTWADEGAVDYSLVIADEQTQGKGRNQRRWVTTAGSSLAFSLILKPNATEIDSLALFAPLSGLAVHDTLFDLFGLQAEIKWPNDILLDRKKSCGILVEAAWTGNRTNAVVLGIGVNISPASIPPSSSQMFPSTCLEDAVGKSIDRYMVLQHILCQIKKWRPLLGEQQFFDRWQEYLAFKGEQVMIVQSEKQSIIGVEKGIDRYGKLVLILDDQKEMAFEVGDVHLRPLALSSEIGGTHA